jgi:hypothetical protein
MLQKNIISALFLLPSVLLTVAGAQPPDTLWTQTFGGTNYDEGYDVQQTADGGYILTGVNNSFGAGGQDGYLVRTDAAGDTIWTRTFGGSSSDYGYDVKPTQDGGFIVAGGTSSYGAGGKDVYLLKYNASGDTTWTRTYGGGLNDYGWNVQQTPDWGYIIAGETYSYGAGASDVYLIKTDQLGNETWTQTVGGGSTDRGFCVQQTADEGYIITGSTYSFGAGDYDVYLIKTNAAGDTLWTRTFGGTSDDVGYSVRQTQDGGYIIAGYTDSFSVGSSDVYLIKTNPSGGAVWSQTFGGVGMDKGYSVCQIQSGGYVVAGGTYSLGAGSSDVYLIGTNSYGVEIWSCTVGGGDVDDGYCVQQTQDGGFIVVGGTESFGAGNADVYLIRFDSVVGITSHNYGQPREFALHPVFPNPFNPVTTFRIELPVASWVTIGVYDIFGRRIQSPLQDSWRQAGSHEMTFDGSYLSSGIYIYRLEAGDFSASGKMVLMK